MTAADSSDSLHCSAEPMGAITEATSPLTSSKPNPLLAWVRGRVSQNKRRWVDERFNLDLTYITPNLIAMGYPAQGAACCYRNSMDEVERFLDERHNGQYWVYNLCSEMHYDAAPPCFHGRFARFPFDDHCVPTLELIHDFVAHALAWLSAEPPPSDGEVGEAPSTPAAMCNVAVVHCKAGKGRTGLMVSCLLLAAYPDVFPDAAAAIQYFDHMRTVDSSGMTVPSQRRYVHYFDYMQRSLNGVAPACKDSTVRLRSVAVESSSFHKVADVDDVYFVVLGPSPSPSATASTPAVSGNSGGSLDDIPDADHPAKKKGERHAGSVVLLDSRPLLPEGPLVAPAKCLFDLPAHTAVLCGSIRIVFYKRKALVLRGCESAAFSIALHTYFCCFEEECTLHFSEKDVDGLVTEKVGKTLRVSLSFEKVDEPSSAAPIQ